MTDQHPARPDGGECENTDRELWRGPDDGCGDFYADSLHITKEGALGINCGGMVCVKPIREWHRLASSEALYPCHDCGQHVLKINVCNCKYGSCSEQPNCRTVMQKEREAREAEPVAWRWKPKHSTSWIYDPEASWLADQSIDTVDVEPLYAAPPVRDREAK